MRNVVVVFTMLLPCACGKGDEPPRIVAQPIGMTLQTCQTLTLSVTAQGTPPLAYQWFKDGVALSNATGSVISLENADTTDSGLYEVKVTNSAGSVESSDTQVEVIQAPEATGPVTIVDRLGGEVLLLSDLLVWSDTNGLYSTSVRCPGAVQTLFSDPGAGPSGLLSNDGNVIWYDGNAGSHGIFSTRVSDASTTAIAQPSFELGGLLLVNGVLVWTDAANDEVGMLPLNGSNITDYAAGTGEPGPLAATSTTIFWADLQQSSISRMPMNGGTVDTLATNQDYVYQLQTDGTYLYWISTSGLGTANARSFLRRMSVDGGAVTELASQAPGAGSRFVIDGSNLYWSVGPAVYPGGSDGSGAIYRVASDGSKVDTLANGLLSPGGLTVGSGHLYWAEYVQGGGIVRLLLPE